MKQHWMKNIAGGLVVAVLLVASVPKVKYYLEFQTIQEGVHREAGIYLNAMTSDDQIFAALTAAEQYSPSRPAAPRATATSPPRPKATAW